MTFKELWSILRGRQTNFRWANASLTYYPKGDPAGLPRACTCHPDDNPPTPCPQMFALTECRKAAQQRPDEGHRKCAHCNDTGKVLCFSEQSWSHEERRCTHCAPQRS